MPHASNERDWSCICANDCCVPGIASVSLRAVSFESLQFALQFHTSTEWQKLRNKNKRAVNRGQESAKAYNLETFLIKWVQGRGGATRLAMALKDSRVKDALESVGIYITDTQDNGDDIFRSSTIRREMRKLLKKDPFGDFEPYAGQSDNAATIAEMCKTSWLEDTLQQMWPTLQAEAPRMVAFFSQTLQNQVNILGGQVTILLLTTMSGLTIRIRS